MRVIIAGQKSFGAAVLDAVADAGHDVAEVWAPSGQDALARLALRRGLVPYVGAGHEHVAELKADLVVCAHSHAFVGRRTRNATKLGAIGYHPSLLPRHRGRDAVRWTTHMGDPVAGGSVYWLTDSVDGGPLADQRHCLVRPRDTASELWRRELFPLGVSMLVDVLTALDHGVVRKVEQDEACATWEPAFDVPPLHRPELPEIGPMPEVNGRRLRLVTR